MDCLFCKIIKKEIQADIFYEDEKILAFHDINPQAPVHLLIIPKKHIPCMQDVKEQDKELLGYIMGKVPELSKKAGLEKEGFRLVTNSGANSGQAVFHLHFHLLGKRKFKWPPG